MSPVLKFGPGVVAALLALFVVKLIAWLGWASWSGEIAIFLLVYLVAAVSTERAMLRYGGERRSGD